MFFKVYWRVIVLFNNNDNCLYVIKNKYLVTYKFAFLFYRTKIYPSLKFESDVIFCAVTLHPQFWSPMISWNCIGGYAANHLYHKKSQCINTPDLGHQ